MQVAERRRAGARAGWTLVDQVLSSAGNFVLGVLVARAVPAGDYGVFAVAFGVYAVTLGISRALATDPLVVRYASAPEHEQRRPRRAALGTALAFGTAVGLVLLAAATVVGGPLGRALVALAIVLPGLLLQDAYRYAAFAAGTPRHAATADLAWVVAFAAVLFTLRPADTPSYLVAWGGAAVLGAVAGAVALRAAPRAALAPVWVADNLGVGGRFVVEFLLVSGTSQAVLLVLALTAGYAEAGAMRGASVLLGPVAVLSSGVVTAAVPEAVRVKDRSLADLRRLVRAVAAALGAAAVVWGGVTAALPADVGSALLGDTWTAARRVVVPLAVAAAGLAACSGLTVGMRALADARRSLVATTRTFLLVLLGGVVGAVLAGAWGAAVGMIVPACWGLLAFARQLDRALEAAK